MPTWVPNDSSVLIYFCDPCCENLCCRRSTYSPGFDHCLQVPSFFSINPTGFANAALNQSVSLTHLGGGVYHYDNGVPLGSATDTCVIMSLEVSMTQVDSASPIYIYFVLTLFSQDPGQVATNDSNGGEYGWTPSAMSVGTFESFAALTAPVFSSTGSHPASVECVFVGDDDSPDTIYATPTGGSCFFSGSLALTFSSGVNIVTTTGSAARWAGYLSGAVAGQRLFLPCTTDPARPAAVVLDSTDVVVVEGTGSWTYLGGVMSGTMQLGGCTAAITA